MDPGLFIKWRQSQNKASGHEFFSSVSPPIAFFPPTGAGDYDSATHVLFSFRVFSFFLSSSFGRIAIPLSIQIHTCSSKSVNDVDHDSIESQDLKCK